MSFSDLLDEVHAFIRRFVIFPSPHEIVFLTLWVAHTWAISAAWATPYPRIFSPVPRCGKSTLIEVLWHLVRQPKSAANITAAALFRLIARDTPTILLDEVDQQFSGDPEMRAAIGSVLNAGYKRGAGSIVVRCVGTSHEPTEFETFCPKALGTLDVLGVLKASTLDRTVPVRLERKDPGQACERFRPRAHAARAAELTALLEAGIGIMLHELESADPELPDQLNDRAREVWEPLLAIADAAGGTWSSRAREAAMALSGTREDDEEHHGIELLRHLRELFDRNPDPVMGSAQLARALTDRDEWPWAGWRGRGGAGLRAYDLARLLRPFRIRPKTVRLGPSTFKGYHRRQFEPTWEKYLGEAEWVPFADEPDEDDDNEPSSDIVPKRTS